MGPMARRHQRVLLAGLLGVALLALAWDRGLMDPAVEHAMLWRSQARPRAPTVLFVVLDTVRADHCSLCGYERPTTPTLDRLRARGARSNWQAGAPRPPGGCHCGSRAGAGRASGRREGVSGMRSMS